MPSFFENDSDALDSLMFFERLAYKTDLISMIIEQTHSVTDSLNSVVPENLVGLCEVSLRHFDYLSFEKPFNFLNLALDSSSPFEILVPQ